MTRTTGPEGKSRELTGRKVLIIALSCFGVVLAVNLTMMTLAITGFPGLVATNPYVEAQGYDAEMKAERALGWQVGAVHRDGRLRVSILEADGAPAQGIGVSARVGRPATDSEDRTVALMQAPDGAHETQLDLASGVWRVEITAVRPTDGARYVIVDQVLVRP